MQITLDARMGLTASALASRRAVVHLTQMRESLMDLPLYADPLRDVCSERATIVLSVIQSDPTDFPVKITVEIPNAHLGGNSMRERAEDGQRMIRQALDNMDTVLNEEAFVIDPS